MIIGAFAAATPVRSALPLPVFLGFVITFPFGKKSLMIRWQIKLVLSVLPSSTTISSIFWGSMDIERRAFNRGEILFSSFSAGKIIEIFAELLKRKLLCFTTEFQIVGKVFQ